MNASQSNRTRTARFAALIAIGRIVPISVAAPSIPMRSKSNWRAHPVDLPDVHPVHCAVERFDGEKDATWHGNCVPLLRMAIEDTTAKHGASRQRDNVQIRCATHSQEMLPNEGRELRVAK